MKNRDTANRLVELSDKRSRTTNELVQLLNTPGNDFARKLKLDEIQRLDREIATLGEELKRQLKD